MILTIRTVTGNKVAYSCWLVNGQPTVVKITQAEYEQFAVTNKGVGDAPGRPDPAARFLLAAGGIDALNTPDGRPSAGDMWEETDSETGLKRFVIATGNSIDWKFETYRAGEPDTTSKTSVIEGFNIKSSGNRIVLKQGDYTGAGNKLTLTKSIPGITIDKGNLTVESSFTKVEKADITGTIPNHKSVTFDAASSAVIDSGTSVTFSHTVASQSNLYMGLGGSHRAGGPITAATYNGDALTSQLDVSNRARVVYWDLVNPDTGTNNVVVTSGTGGASGVWSAYGVDQTTPRTDAQTNSGISASPAITLSSATGELVLTVIGWDANDDDNTTDATWTQDWSLEPATGNDRGGAGAHKAGASSVTRTDTLAGSRLAWAAAGVSIKAASGAEEHVKNLNDSVTLSDSLLKTMLLNKSDSMNVAEQFMNKPSMIKLDSISISDLLIKTAALNKSDNVTISDLFDRISTYIRDLTDGVTITDLLNNKPTKNLSDTVTLADILSNKPRIINTDSIGITDSLIKTIGKNPDDILAIADSISKTIGVAKLDTLSLADTISKVVGFNKTDSVSITDSATTQIIILSILSDTISLSDSLIKTLVKSFTDTQGLSDLIVKIVGFNKTDTLTISDQMSTQALGLTLLSDNVSISDAIAKITDKNLTDNEALADSIIKTLGFNKTDSITITENMLAQILIYAVLTDNMTFADSLVRVVGKSITEIVIVTDTLAKVIGLTKTESLSISDAISKIVIKNPVDTITIIDAYNKAIEKNPTDSVAIAENLIKVITKAISDNMTLTDVISVIGGTVIVPPHRNIYEYLPDRIKRKLRPWTNKGDKISRKLD